MEVTFDLHLPGGFSARPATWDDLDTVAQLVQQAELIDLGEPMVTVEDIHATWSRPGFQLADDTVMVFEDDRAVAHAEVSRQKAEVSIYPDARNRGLGSALLRWTEKRAAADAEPGGTARIGQTVSDKAASAIDLFVKNGYEHRHTSWILMLPDGVGLATDAPAGVTVRPHRPGVEDHEIYQVVEDAFNEWPNRTPTSFDEWAAWTTNRLDFDPDLLWVAEREHEIIGAAFGIAYPGEGWIDQLAVRADARGQGIARALLAAVFGTFREKGFPKMGLNTDSRTGALDLYLKLGMDLTSTFVHYSKLVERPA